jgi:hypothetical protein
MNIEMVEVGKLVPYAMNAKLHSESQVATIAGSIREFGFCNPVLIDDSGGIIAGHGRVMAARQLGLKEVPCVRLSHLDENRKRAYILADNRLAETGGGWDEERLKLELAEIDWAEMENISLEGMEWGGVGPPDGDGGGDIDLGNGEVEPKESMSDFRVFLPSGKMTSTKATITAIVESAGGYVL